MSLGIPVQGLGNAVRRPGTGGLCRMSAILFDRDRVDHLEVFPNVRIACGGRSCSGSISTTDLSSAPRRSPKELDLDDETRRCLTTPNEKACFTDFGQYIHITTYAPREDEEGELHAVECVVGQNWVVTAHDWPIPVLDEFAAARLRLRRYRLARWAELPRRAARMGARLLHRGVRADRAATGGLRRPGDARTGSRRRHRAAGRDAPRGRQAAPRARRPPLSPGRAHPP